MKKIDFTQLKERLKIFTTDKHVRIGAIVLAVIIAGALFTSIPWNRLLLQGDPNMINGRNAYDIALLRAKEWQPDVLMDRINSGQIGDAGKAKTWSVTFVSKNVTGKGFVVEVANRKVISTAEIPYVGAGADYPVETISQEEAIRRFRQMPGFENEPIISVEAIYAPTGKMWYWGIKTAKGTSSVQAN